MLSEEVRYPLAEEAESLELDMKNRESDVTEGTEVSNEPEDSGVTPVCDPHPMSDNISLPGVELGTRPASPTNERGKEAGSVNTPAPPPRKSQRATAGFNKNPFNLPRSACRAMAVGPE